MRISIILILLSLALQARAQGFSWAQKQLESMSIEQKIGQLFMVPTASLLKQTVARMEALSSSSGYTCPYNLDHDYIEHLIRDYYIGGIIFLYGNAPGQQVACINRFNKLSNIPLLVGLDAEWGPSMRHPSVIKFPRNMTLAAVDDSDLIHQLGKLIGKQLKLLGVHINFAPVVDVNNNPANPVIHDRSFGDDKRRVARLGIAFMRGMQESGILACAKHFPGHGDTNVDSHIGLPTIAHHISRLEDIELYPFKQLIDAGVDAVMLAHLLVPAFDADKPTSLSSKIIRPVLMEKLGFNGLIVTDGLGMKAIRDNFPAGEAELQAVIAGNDMIVGPTNVAKAVEKIKEAIWDGRLPIAELDRRVLKILRIKEKQGLPAIKSARSPEVAELNSPAAYALKKKLYQHAITYVGNQHALDSITPESHCILQLGADELSPLAHMLQEKGFKVIQNKGKSDEAVLDEMGSYQGVIVALHGITKCAQQSYGLSEETLQLWRKVQKQNKALPVIFGSPYSLNLLQPNVALLAYENDPDAQEGVAQILLHKRKPTGKLPVQLSYLETNPQSNQSVRGCKL